MKIRIYSPFFPFPITEGAFRVIFDQVISLQALHHEVELITWKNSREDLERRSRLWAQTWPLPQVRHFPETKVRSPFWRVAHSLFSHLTPKNVASPEIFYYPLEVLSRLTEATWGPCDWAIYHYSFAHAWLRERHKLPLETRRAVHFHNLESVLFRLRSKNTPRRTSWIHLRNAQILARHEKELGSLCSETWFVSPFDLKTFSEASQRKSHPKARTRLVPPTYSSLFSRETPPTTKVCSSTTTTLGLIGGFDFQPNRDSAAWIFQELVPALEKRNFKGRLQILGRNAPNAFVTQKLPPWVEILPEDYLLENFLNQLSWMLVPHVSGSGVRIKLLDALAHRIPVMATPDALNGLHPDLKKHPLIFTSLSAQDWAERILKEPPSETRRRLQNLPFPLAMQGEEIYRFVAQQEI